jgi:hypothetical protein
MNDDFKNLIREYKKVLGGLGQTDGHVHSTIQRNIIEEGLIKSWDVNHLKSDLMRTLKDDIPRIGDSPMFPDLGSRDGIPASIMVLFKPNFDIKKLDPILNRSGYFIAKEPSTVDYKGHKLIRFRLEPKFSIPIEIPIGIRIFHITTKDKVKKILNNGLLAKDTTTDFNHPNDRIYLFITNEPRYYLPLVINMLASSKNKTYEDMSVIEINRNYKGKYYYDESSQQNSSGKYYAVFTFDAIHPNSLSIYE